MKGIFITVICGCILFLNYADVKAAGKNSDPKTAVKNTVLKNLKDPYSARFGDFSQINNKYACITVNAKNTYGGYVGNREAYLFKGSNSWVLIDFYEISHSTCIGFAKNAVMRNYEESLIKKAVLNHIKGKPKLGTISITDNFKAACISVNYDKDNDENGEALSNYVILSKKGNKWGVLSVEEMKDDVCRQVIDYIPFKSGAELEAIKAVIGKRSTTYSNKFGYFKQIDDNHACLAVNEEDSEEINQLAILERKDSMWNVVSFKALSIDSCNSTIENNRQ